MKYCIQLLFAGICFQCSAQVSNVNVIASGNPMIGYSIERSGAFFAGNDGRPIRYNSEVVLVSGTPYLLEHFFPARIVLATGAVYDGVRVRLNLLANELQYRNAKGEEMVTSAPVKELLIRDTTNNSVRQVVSGQTMPPQLPGNGWYEQLAAGKAALYKRTEKSLLSRKQYNSATEEKWVESKDRLFVVINNTGYEVKKLRELLPLLADKAQAMEQFAKEHDKKSKSWQQTATAAVLYYNSL